MKPVFINFKEEQEASTLNDYLLVLLNQGKVLEYTHVPHETYTNSWSVKMRNKRSGVRKGVPDYIILTKKAILFLELKRTKGGILSPEQRMWIEVINEHYPPTVKAAVCLGFFEAKQFIDDNL